MIPLLPRDLFGEPSLLLAARPCEVGSPKFEAVSNLHAATRQTQKTVPRSFTLLSLTSSSYELAAPNWAIASNFLRWLTTIEDHEEVEAEAVVVVVVVVDTLTTANEDIEVGFLPLTPMRNPSHQTRGRL